MTYIIDPVLWEVLYSTDAGSADTWVGPNGELVVYHRLGDFWTWQLAAGGGGRSDMQEVVLSALGLLSAEMAIRKAVAGHVHNDRAEIEVTRNVLAALEAAGFVIIEATALDGV